MPVGSRVFRGYGPGGSVAGRVFRGYFAPPPPPLTGKIPNLIDTPDAFEIVRDQIAAILAIESESQQALALAAGKDPDLWKLRVFLERSDPWDLFQDQDPDDTSPIVNVWYASTSYDGAKSSAQGYQIGPARYNIDVIGYGRSTETAEGHNPGDRAATLEAHRGLRLVRRILMAAPYMRLCLPDIVGKRMPAAQDTFQPPTDPQTVSRVTGARLALDVQITERNEQPNPTTLDTLGVTVYEADNGQIVAEYEKDYTTN